MYGEKLIKKNDFIVYFFTQNHIFPFVFTKKKNQIKQSLMYYILIRSIIDHYCH